MNEKREMACNEIFDTIDTRKEGKVTVQGIMDNFFPENHLLVEQKKATPDEIYDDFYDKLELLGRLGVPIYRLLLGLRSSQQDTYL